MVFITLITSNIKCTYSLQFFTFLSIFFQFFPILFIFSYNYFQFLSILSIFSYNYVQFFSILSIFSYNSFHFFLQFFSILSNSSVNSKELSKNRKIWKEMPEKNWRIAEHF